MSAACDPTLLRKKLGAEAASSLGLAAPAVEPVALVVNGRFQGVYFNIEVLDPGCQRLAGLDRVGLFALRTRGDLLENDWTTPCRGAG